MRSCEACKFSKARASHVLFHSFPKNEALRNQWISNILEACGQEGTTIKSQSVLCSQHFEDSWYFYPHEGDEKTKYLKPDAVPTIFGFHYVRGRLVSHKEAGIKNKIEEHQVTQPSVETQNLLSPSNSDERERFHTSIAVVKLELEHDIDANPDLMKHVTEPHFKTLGDSEVHPIKNEVFIKSEYDMTDDSNSMLSKRDIRVDESSTEFSDRRDVQQDGQKALKRKRTPAFIGDCLEEDLKDPKLALHNWRLAIDTINQQKKKIKALQIQVKRLKKKVGDMRLLLKK